MPVEHCVQMTCHRLVVICQKCQAIACRSGLRICAISSSARLQQTLRLFSAHQQPGFRKHLSNVEHSVQLLPTIIEGYERAAQNCLPLKVQHELRFNRQFRRCKVCRRCHGRSVVNYASWQLGQLTQFVNLEECAASGYENT